MLIDFCHQNSKLLFDFRFRSVIKNRFQQGIDVFEQGTVLGVDLSVTGLIGPAPDQLHQLRIEPCVLV